MKYLKIQNIGELDVRLISLMGGSTKRGNASKIGQFGTGLKYSLAWLMRNNIDFKLFIGEKQVELSSKVEKISDIDFQILYIDGERTSISAQMGLDWEGWMIMRELYCNAKDEGEYYVEEIDGISEGREGYTTFYLQLAGELKTVREEWGEYFLDESQAIQVHERFKIYPAAKGLRIYKQGVLIKKDDDQKAIFAYDIPSASINELRQYTGYLDLDLGNIIPQLSRENVERLVTIIGKSDEHVESGIDYSMWSSYKFNDNWKDAFGSGKIISIKDYAVLEAKGIINSDNQDQFIQLPEKLTQRLCVNHPHLNALRSADAANSFYEFPNDEADLNLRKALAILETCNYFMNDDLKWIVGVFGNPKTIARVNIDEKLVMFSIELARRPLIDVILAIVEENEHYLSGFKDCTRDFQTHFIRLFALEILKRNNVEL